ncbi:MAG: DoxX family membrane protein [Actinomycetota bacterium]|nr:DoxX family membrane protein [Actinomycetota bacterium]MDQ2957336.1 DoxX family membrane protein [Actinomycetota bacterium]
MSLAAKLRRAPGRVAAGSFILNSGLGKLSGDAATAKAIHSMAAGSYPVLRSVPPVLFLKLLAVSEVAIGSMLLLPIVGPRISGLALGGFSVGLLGLYVRTPGMHDDRYRPTQQGIPIAKDVWLAAIGAGLLIDGTLDRT